MGCFTSRRSETINQQTFKSIIPIEVSPNSNNSNQDADSLYDYPSSVPKVVVEHFNPQYVKPSEIHDKRSQSNYTEEVKKSDRPFWFITTVYQFPEESNKINTSDQSLETNFHPPQQPR